MIAEIHNKISMTGRNLHDRLEDQLTGNVFGSLRYLPYSTGMQTILSQAYFEKGSQRKDFEAILSTINDSAEIIYRFWPRHPKGEIDLIIETPACVIGFEVKYKSGLSSDDDVDNSNQQEWVESNNQLSRYQSIIRDYEGNGKVKILLFTAPTELGFAIYQDVLKRNLMNEDFLFGLLTWENILTALQHNPNPPVDRYQRVIHSDIIELLRKKDFEYFKGFEHNDIVSITLDSYGYDMTYVYSSLSVKKEFYYEYR